MASGHGFHGCTQALLLVGSTFALVAPAGGVLSLTSPSISPSPGTVAALLLPVIPCAGVLGEVPCCQPCAMRGPGAVPSAEAATQWHVEGTLRQNYSWVAEKGDFMPFLQWPRPPCKKLFLRVFWVKGELQGMFRKHAVGHMH